MKNSILVVLLAVGTTAFAQQEPPAPPTPPAEAGPPEATLTPDEVQELEDLVVTGTRVKGRSPAHSISPIDAVNGAELEREGTFDLTDTLRVTAPSFNTQRYPIADGTAFIRPANLRNLSPDQTLVLINGKRRHRSALVNLQVDPFGTVNQGAQSVDFALIPSAAIERVEILLDGASAQYGSDAIAGVINILLKQEATGSSYGYSFGQAFAGDGQNRRAWANIGRPFAGGFFNLTAEAINTEATSRGNARPDAATVADAVGAGNVAYGGLGQRWGDPDSEGQRLFLNMELDASDTIRMYGHGNYAQQDHLSSFFYRTPVGVAGVTPRGTLFVDAVNNTTGLAPPDGLADNVPQSIVDDLVAQGSDPADYLTADGASPSGYVALNPIASRFPGGYTPRFGANTEDSEAVLGLRGQVFGKLEWDVSGRYGVNEVVYVLENSINPSLGQLSPTRFRPGVLEQREGGLNADFVYPLDTGVFATPLNFAFGAEYRTETYEIGIGDPDSFESSPTGILFGVGSDGFQGDPPDAAGTFGRKSTAAYVDFETDVVERVSLGIAGRFEDSDAFDSSFDWKLSGRVQALDWLGVRATVSTGFRAPTPGQINTLDITTTADASGALVPLGTFPVNSAVAVALGAVPLETETSFNTTFGIVLTPSATLSLSVDYYRIELEDRIALATIDIDTPAERQALIDAGVDNANLIDQVSFFTNAFDTTVEGIDVAATQRLNLGDLGNLVLDLRHAYNRQTVDRFDPGTISPDRVFDLENQLPQNRSTLSFNYQTPVQVDALLRFNYYSGWKDQSFGEESDFGGAVLVDLIGTVHFLGRFHVSAGGENVFDEHADEETNGTLSFLGATDPVSSPFGSYGGLWFVRVGATF